MKSLFHAILLAILFHMPVALASTYVDARADFHALNEVGMAATSLVHDMSREFFQDSLKESCLNSLFYATHDNIFRGVSEALPLLTLSGSMQDSNDEFEVNELLVSNIDEALQSIGDLRTTALLQARVIVVCSTSPLINAYAQKVTALADNATTAFNTVRAHAEAAVKDHLASISNAPRQ